MALHGRELAKNIIVKLSEEGFFSYKIQEMMGLTAEQFKFF